MPVVSRDMQGTRATEDDKVTVAESREYRSEQESKRCRPGEVVQCHACC